MDLNITQEPAGHTAQGLPLSLFTLRNRNGLAARISTLGGALVSLSLPDRHGHLAEVMAPGDDLGPGIHLLPARGHALHRLAWHAVPLVTDLAVGVRLVSPGPHAVVACFTLNDANELTLAFESALAPPATLCLRGCFNLVQEGGVLHHLLSVQAARCVPAGAAEQAVEGSAWDCRRVRPVAELPGPARYLLDAGAAVPLCLADPASGRQLELLTNADSVRLGCCGDPPGLMLEPLAPAANGLVVWRFSTQA